ncbi:MAG: hypothetical protein M3365_09760 [Gemmatimonadota bacterium]|nr:hypothetical protein [Gemmatimonadota bacterium]
MRDPARELLRHALATVAYRGAKACRDAPRDFADTRLTPDSRTAREILAHIGDLYDWAAQMAKGNWTWHTAAPLPWPEEIARFHRTLGEFDALLAGDAPLGFPAETLFQGPVADSLTHIGQLCHLRRLAGSPVRGESYARAEIAKGRVGPEQAKSNAEFD